MGSDRSLIAHLFRRAAFGARPAEVTYYANAGYDVAVEDLLTATSVAGGQPSFREGVSPVWTPAMNIRGKVAVAGLDEIRVEWLERMVTTSTPLVERMTLFLHDHFATGYRPGDNIDTPELYAQNTLFRENALGNWRALLHAMLTDVALSCWLDNNVNVKSHPNENLARELMELFTLGLGNYTEQDIREGARALTGYQLAFNLSATGPRNSMVYNAGLHDDGTKTFLGRTGKFTPTDVIEIILAQPAAPAFIANKLVKTFAGPSAPSSLVDRVASALVAANWELVPALRTLFTSAEFKNSASYNTTVKSPAEFVAGSLRALRRTENDAYQRGIAWMTSAGQSLYDPPNVGGWPSNEGWLGAGQLLARYNSAVALGDLHAAALALPGVPKVGGQNAAEWGSVFGISELSGATKTALDGYLEDSAAATPQVRDAGMVTLVVSSPEFSLA